MQSQIQIFAISGQALSNRLSAVEELSDIFKARPVPMGEFFRIKRILLSKDIFFDENLIAMQKKLKKSSYLTLLFISLFLLLGFSGKFIIRWAG